MLNDLNWTECLNQINGSSKYKDWCNSCATLSNCLIKISDIKFNKLLIKTFIGWKDLLTKNLIIKSLVVTYFINPSTDYFAIKKSLTEFSPFFASYIKRVTPFPNANLTLLDAWSYSFGTNIYQDNTPAFHEYLDKIPIAALSNCTINGMEESCLIAKEFSKQNSKYQGIWINIYDKIFSDFIPLCSFGTNDFKLFKCANFFRSITKTHHKPCFTFKMPSSVPTLGLTKGLNFLVNFDYTASETEVNDPVSIVIHEPTESPDIEDIRGMIIQNKKCC